MDKAVTRAVHEWPGVLDKDDLSQSLWVELLETPGLRESLEESAPDIRLKELYELALDLIKRERDEYERFSGNVTYGLSEVRGMLLQGGLDPLRDNVTSNFRQVTD